MRFLTILPAILLAFMAIYGAASTEAKEASTYCMPAKSCDI